MAKHSESANRMPSHIDDARGWACRTGPAIEGQPQERPGAISAMALLVSPVRPSVALGRLFHSEDWYLFCHNYSPLVEPWNSDGDADLTLPSHRRH